jgi:prepilin-type N-terminal cleavage/methylation domain-containing protein
MSLLPTLRRFRRRRIVPAACAAFTLVEIVISLAVLGTMASGCYIGFNAINAYAVSSRLYSEAQAAAHNQIDLILSKGPFDYNGAYISGTFDATLNKIPVELMTRAELDALVATGVVFPTTPPTAAPAITSKYYPYYPYYRTGANQPIQKKAFIYQDPVTGQVIVTGTLTSTIEETGMSMTYITTTPTSLNTRRATAAITYSFRNRDYNVAMDTLRTADQ